jgi:hypothetical protein
MPQPNIKLYIILSGVLALILIVILIIPINRKTQTTDNGADFPTPTTIDSAGRQNAPVIEPTVKTSDFTGVEEETLPKEISDQSTQKQELRYRTPVSFTTFSVDFSYTEDKFTIFLNDPKDVSLREFEEWKRNNYPSIPMDQFIFN